MPDDRHDIFLSYSRQNRDFAIDLYQKLEAFGFSLWRDIHDIPAGDDFWRVIKEAIDGCETLVLCMSLDALKSPFVSQEWNYAREIGRRVIPIIADEVFEHPEVISGEFVIPNWMQRKNWMDFRNGVSERDKLWDRFIATLKMPHEPRRVFITRKASELPPTFVPRPNESEPVIKALVTDARDAVALTAALKGAGGYGKTTLAKAIIRDLRVSGAFDDGIYWVTLGEELLKMMPDMRNNTLKAYVTDLIREITGKSTSFDTLEAASEELTRAIGDQYLLLVVDDVWHATHLKPFLVKGQHNATLITTRDADTLPVDTQRHDVDEMQRQESVALLAARFDPKIVQGYERALDALAKRLGDYPLLLGAVNGALRKQIEHKSLADALMFVNDRLTSKGLTAFNANLPQERQDAVDRTLDVSLEFLLSEEAAHYRELVIFPEDVRIPLTTLAALWGCNAYDAETLCQLYYDRSLLQDFDGKTIAIHDVVRTYLREKTTYQATELHERLIDGWGDLYTLPDVYAWQNAAYHLQGAKRNSNLIDLLLDYRWLQAKLNLIDVNHLIEDFDTVLNVIDDSSLEKDVERTLRLVRSAVEMSAHMVAKDKQYFPSQLSGRLADHKSNELVKQFFETIEFNAPRPCLLPINATYEQAGGALIRVLTGHKSQVRTVAFSTDGTKLASADTDASIILWDIRTGTQITRFDGHAGAVNAVTFSPDGIFLASASDDNSICLWDVYTGTIVARLIGHAGAVNAIDFSLDSTLLASASDDRTVRLWDIHKKQSIAVLDGHKGKVNAVAFSRTGMLLASASHDLSIRIWDAITKTEIMVLRGHSDWVSTLDFSFDGKFLASGSLDRNIHLWNLPSGTIAAVLKGYYKGVRSIAFSPNNIHLISSSNDGAIHIWDFNEKSEVVTLTGHSQEISSISISPDGSRLATGSYDKDVRLWDPTLGKVDDGHARHTNKVTALAFSPTLEYLLSVSHDKTICYWKPNTGGKIAVLQGHTNWIRDIAFSPDGNTFASVSDDQTIRLWNANEKELVAVFRGHTNGIRCVAFSPDGKMIATGSNDDTVRLWDSQSGDQISLLADHIVYVNSLKFSPDGAKLAVAHLHKTIDLYDIATNKKVASLEGHEDNIYNISFSQDGDFLISGSADHTIRLWDIINKQQLACMSIHDSAVIAVSFSPDGLRLVSASEDHTIRIWDMRTYEPITVFEADDPLLSVVWSPVDPSLLAAADEAGRVMFFRWLE